MTSRTATERTTVVKRTSSENDEYKARIEDWKETQHKSLTFEGRFYEEGDDIYVQLPNASQGIKATFLAYVTPKKGRAYVSIITRKGVNRVIRPEAILRGGKKL